MKEGYQTEKTIVDKERKELSDLIKQREQESAGKELFEKFKTIVFRLGQQKKHNNYWEDSDLSVMLESRPDSDPDSWSSYYEIKADYKGKTVYHGEGRDDYKTEGRLYAYIPGREWESIIKRAMQLVRKQEIQREEEFQRKLLREQKEENQKLKENFGL